MTERSVPHPAVAQAADRLARAARAGVPCPPVRELLASVPARLGATGDPGAGGDVDAAAEAAYAVQRLGVRRRLAAGHRVVGRKVGLTSPAVQRQLGVDRPDFGALLSDMAVPDGGRVAPGRLLQPKVEAEVALVLGADLTGEESGVADVLRATEHALPALEIVDSRIAGWDISFTDTVADNASSGLFVLGGPATPLSAGLDLAAVRMTLTRNGEPASAGSGADCLGSPLNAAAWLATTLARRGDPLRAGDVVLTGALGPMVPAAPGDVFETRITGLGTARVAFAGGSATDTNTDATADADAATTAADPQGGTP